jgi:serine/threonine protein kinase
MYDIHKNEGVYYITMEYVPGQDLKSLIRQTGHLAIPTVISIGLQVCAGLEEAHKMGVIHRDLKPHNTMIDTLGHVRIMDFGIASSLRSNEKTSHDTIIGSPAHMSPEQASAQSLDQRSDIYSLGVILYEMATGEQPFQGTDPIVVALKHKTEEAKAPRELNPKLPEGLNLVILKCLAKDRERRFQSALDLSFALKNLQILSESQEKPREAIRENSIAVLPFADLSPQGYHVWSESFDRDLDDVFAIQDQVTMAIIEKFDIKLVEKDKKQLRQRRTQDAAEYQAYLKGRFFLNNRTEEGFRASISYFQQMIEKNPESALGYTGLADAYNSLGYFNYMPAAEARFESILDGLKSE